MNTVTTVLQVVSGIAMYTVVFIGIVQLVKGNK